LLTVYVASSGIASLLLSGEHTAHSWFKIPIPVYEASTCNIKKNDQFHQLLNQTALIVWDEVPMQHHHAIESVDHTLQDLLAFWRNCCAFWRRFSSNTSYNSTWIQGANSWCYFMQILPLATNSASPSLYKHSLGSKYRMQVIYRVVTRNWCWTWCQC